MRYRPISRLPPTDLRQMRSVNGCTLVCTIVCTKLVGDKHDRWPDLLGTVALAYKATVHTSTGYSPHKLFYSFAPACPLDALVTTPMPEPVNNADEYALQAMERLQEAARFVRSYTGRQIQRMKQS